MLCMRYAHAHQAVVHNMIDALTLVDNSVWSRISWKQYNCLTFHTSTNKLQLLSAEEGTFYACMWTLAEASE